MPPNLASAVHQTRPPAPIVYRVCGRPGHNDRPPLPAGHPISWQLLTNGTSLEGARYPFPVFNLNSG